MVARLAKSSAVAEQEIELPPPRSAIALARSDLIAGLKSWWLWNAMSWQDIMQRYRGSVLGPLWLTLSMAVMVVALGILYSALFGIDIDDFLPFFCLGIIWWTLVSGMIVESCRVFTESEAIIKQIRMPASIHVYRMIWRNLIITGHNLIVYAIVAIVFGIAPNASTLLVVPGLVLVIVNAVWIALLLGMVCARFRDFAQIVASVMQIAFFLTPIIWKPELLGPNQDIAHLNPFFALIDLLRAPLLGQAPHPLSWTVAAGMAVAGWAIGFWFFSRFRGRIPYWC